MTKLDLQQELLEKVKLGTKPSDIKRQVKHSQIPKPVNQDEGYESDKSGKSIPVAPPFKPDLSKSGQDNNLSLPNQDLINQISSLKKQLQTYKDFKEVDLKIKEKYKQEIKELQQENNRLSKITDLEKPAKNPTEINPEPIKTFLCSSCQQTKPTQQLSRVFGDCSFCLECSKKARKQAQQEKQPSPQEEFTCHSCQQIKTELPNKMKLDSTLTEYLVCSPCRPNLKEFNEADLITDDLWTKYPYSSASEILEKEFGIVKEEPW